MNLLALYRRNTTMPKGNHQRKTNASAAVGARRLRIRSARAFNLWRIV